MNISELERSARSFERRYDLASPAKRMEMRPEVERMIARLRGANYPLPGPLRRMEAVMEAEAFDDMFDNMPV